MTQVVEHVIEENADEIELSDNQLVGASVTNTEDDVDTKPSIWNEILNAKFLFNWNDFCYDLIWALLLLLGTLGPISTLLPSFWTQAARRMFWQPVSPISSFPFLSSSLPSTRYHSHHMWSLHIALGNCRHSFLKITRVKS